MKSSYADYDGLDDERYRAPGRGEDSFGSSGADAYQRLMQPKPGPGFEQIATGFTHESHPAPAESIPLVLSPLMAKDARRHGIRGEGTEWVESKPIPVTTGALEDMTDAERKSHPIGSGFLDYFPDAALAVAHVSYVANEQHNPGQPMHWARSKSTDEYNTAQRHLLQRGTVDKDGLRHTAKAAWRIMALLQKELEEAGEGTFPRGARL